MKLHILKKIPSLTDQQRELLVELFQSKPHIEKVIYIDWNRYKTLTWEDFQEALAYRSKSEVRRNAHQNGVEGLILNQDYAVIDLPFQDASYLGAYIPLSYEISKVLASKSIGGSCGAWCTAYQKTKTYWTDYVILGEDVLIYVVFNHTKYAITVYPKNSHIDIHDIADNEVEQIEGISKKELLAILKKRGDQINTARDFIQNSVPQIERDGGFIGKDYQVNKDGSVDVFGNVQLSNRKLDTLPVTFNYVQGDFDCSNNNLTSLNGAPRQVEGSFKCRKNSLSTLRGGPKEIGTDYDCSSNKLTSLTGAPRSIPGTFSCRENLLETLEGIPKHIDEHIDINNNAVTFSQKEIYTHAFIGGALYL